MKRYLRVLAGLIAFLLIGGLFFVTNAFVGNPISSKMAHRAAENYILENYPSLDLEVSKPQYNFKSGSYIVSARSSTDMDTHFHVYWQSGEILRDDYDLSVDGRLNTLQRLEREYSHLIRSLLETELGFNGNTSTVIYDKPDQLIAKEVLDLGMKFDRTLPLEALVFLELELDNVSSAEIAKIFENVHLLFVQENCHFNTYHLYANKGEVSVSINNVSSEAIESGDLVKVLEKAKATGEAQGISVYIKGLGE